MSLSASLLAADVQPNLIDAEYRHVATIPSFLTRSRHLSGTSKRVLIGLAIGIGGLIALSWIVFEMFAAIAIGHLNKDLLNLPPLSPKLVVCRTGPSAAFADEAARRMGMPTAWMPAPPGYQLRWLGAAALPAMPVDHRYAFEDLASGRFLLTLYTQPDRPWYDQKLIGSSLIQGKQVEVLAPRNPELFPSLRLLWTHLGMTYSLDVNRASFFDSTPLHAKDFLPLIRTVRYADPPSG